MEQKLIVSFDVGIKFLACCAFVVQKGSDCSYIVDWSILALAAEKEKIPAIGELSFRLFEQLDQLVARLEAAGFKSIDFVLIENQPSRLNGAMKSIQMLIYGYFQMRKYTEAIADQVILYAPVNKLKEHTKVIDVKEVIGKKNKRAHYIVNKQKSVAYMKEYIKNCPQLNELLRLHKKQDDMADSLIQGLAWVRKQGYMVEHCFQFQVANGSYNKEEDAIEMEA